MKIISLPGFQTSAVERDFLNGIGRAFSKFGENGSQLVFSKFETDYGLTKSDIFYNPELFTKTLQNIFRFGSSYVEKGIISELKEEFSLPNRDYVHLQDVVGEIRKSDCMRKR